MVRLKLDPEQLEVTSFTPTSPADAGADSSATNEWESLCWVSCMDPCGTYEFRTCGCY